MLGFLKSFFKTKKDKDIAALQPIVAQINAQYAQLKALSDDELRARTQDFKRRIAERIQAIVDELADVRQQIEANRDAGAEILEPLFARQDQLIKDRNATVEAVLSEILPEAFAVVKETCRRLTEVGHLTVTATDWDRELATRKGHIQIQGDKAVWANRWLAAGNEIVWNMVHYDVQLMGGITLHQGKISEMATGEGKTLVSTLPAYLNGLAGLGVHLVTVNDYLARRDSEWNGPIFEFHGLRVDCIDNHEPNTDARRAAYLADITYGTNNEFGFDYLRDNMVTHPEHLVQRPHHYAMIDEVDSVLIDEARTPLIISGPVQHGDRDREEFMVLKPRIERLVNLQRKKVNEELAEARTLIQKAEAGDKEAATKAGEKLLRAQRGLPKHNPLIKLLSEPNVKGLLNKAEAYYLQDNSRNMHVIDEQLYFTIDEKNNQIELTDLGRDTITQAGEDPNLFVLPDITNELYAIDNSAELATPEDKLAAKERLTRDYSEKSERLHSLNQLLKAYTLFDKDVEYIVQEGKVMIVDEHTGRVLSGRRYSDGLHQAIEAKENVKVEAATQTFATVTLQNYFRMYHKLCGMTGTAETEAKELFDIYKLDVVVVPTNRAITRKDEDDVVFRTRREKFNAIIDQIQQLSDAGRPVLVGTTSVETSELVSRMLKQRQIRHNVLNAKQHQREAEIVAEAGQAPEGPDGQRQGNVTIATNMAGRGTDIKLGPGVREAGGLAIIGSERHESRRIDRQLRGRAGRQGDPGSSQFYVSLEDDLMRLFGAERIDKVMRFLKMKEGETIQDPLVTRSITNAQRKVEENNFAIRKRLLEYDDVMNSQREGIYRRRRNALFGDRIALDLDDMIFQYCTHLVGRHHAAQDHEGLRLDVIRHLGFDPETTQEDIEQREDQVAERLYNSATHYYQQKRQRIGGFLAEQIQAIKTQMPHIQLVEVHMLDQGHGVRVFADIDEILRTNGASAMHQFEKTVILSVIDEEWKDHLREMDELKQSVQTAVYEQKDPLLVYKFEAFELYQRMLAKVNELVLEMLFRGEIEERREAAKAPVVRRDDFSRMQAQHADGPGASGKKTVSKTVTVETADGQQQERVLSRRERREMERRDSKKR